MKKIFFLSMISLLTIVFTGCDSKEKELKKLEKEKQAEIQRNVEATDRILRDADEASKNSERAIQEKLQEMEKAERRRKIDEFMSKCRNCNGTGTLTRLKYSGGRLGPETSCPKCNGTGKK